MDQKLKINRAILNGMKFTDIKLTREERNREKLFITADELDSSPIKDLDTAIFSPNKKREFSIEESYDQETSPEKPQKPQF